MPSTRLSTFLEQYTGSRPSSPVPFGNSNMSGPSSSSCQPDYFTMRNSQLDDRDLLDSIPTLPSKSLVQARDETELERITDALNSLSPADSPVKYNPSSKRSVGGGYFAKGVGMHHGGGVDAAGTVGNASSTLSTPSLESDYSSLSASCSPLSTPLDESDYILPPLAQTAAPTSPKDGIAQRRRIQLPKLEIPAFQLDASYFTSKTAAPPPRAKPSTFQFDVSPPRRSKNAYSTSLPSNTASCPPPSKPSTATTSTSWNPEPINLDGIIGERPGSPIRFRQRRRETGFAF
ncbi:hypothetical protein JCM16303_003394 [Sporobolomyces ruberrimus]